MHATTTRLVRTSVDSGPHSLVLRRSPRDERPLDLLPTGDSDDARDVLAVTYHGARQFLEAWRDRVTGQIRNVGVVDVGGQMRSAATESASTASPPGHNLVQAVSDPTDVAGIRREATGYLDAWTDDGRAVAYLDSVTALFDALDVGAATEFLTTLQRALAERSVTGYFCLTPAEHDRATVREVASLFGTVVECVDGGQAIDEDHRASLSEPSVADCFDAVSEERRRRVLGVLADRDSASVEDLALHVDRHEPGRDDPVAWLREDVLPGFEDAGFVTYDRKSGQVSRGEHFDRLEPYLAPGRGRSG